MRSSARAEAFVNLIASIPLWVWLLGLSLVALWLVLTVRRRIRR
jgi:hypothetical protein